MKITSAIVFGSVLLLTQLPAQADQDGLAGFTVQALRGFCSADLTKTILGSFCFGFIEGAGQILAVNGSEAQNIGKSDPEAVKYFNRNSICGGPGVGVPSGGAMVQAYMNWSQKHPEEWAVDALVGVQRALVATWPCQSL